LLCAYAVAFQSLDGLGRAPSKHRKAVEVQIIDPARLSAYNVLRLAPRARKPSGYLHGIRKPAGLLFGATGTEKTPATFRVPFLCAVRSRPPVLHAVQPCCYALTPAALPFACASARPLRSVGCRRRRRRRHPRSPQSPLRMHWRSPRRGTLRQTRLVFALHPSPPRTASPGSGQGCPAFRPDSRFSPVAAETSLRKCRPSESPSTVCSWVNGGEGRAALKAAARPYPASPRRSSSSAMGGPGGDRSDRKDGLQSKPSSRLCGT